MMRSGWSGNFPVPMNDINKAIKILKAGGVIIFPTETVYGIGALASSEKAIKRLYEIKKRPKNKPLQILISDFFQADLFASEISNIARDLMKKYWPGPLTLVLKKKPGISDIITAGGETVGLRMPDDPTILKIIKSVGSIAASSANLSGEPDPTTAGEVKIKADLVLDGGPCREGMPSTVIDASVEPPIILRPGKIILPKVK